MEPTTKKWDKEKKTKKITLSENPSVNLPILFCVSG